VRDGGQQNNHANKKTVSQPVCRRIGVANDRFQGLSQAFNIVDATITTSLQYQQHHEPLIKRHRLYIIYNTYT